MSPPTCVTDVGEIRIIHRIHSENLDSGSSDSQTGHFRIIHTITTERVGADPNAQQPCKITHSVATEGSGARSSPMTCDLNGFKIEHILTVNPLPPETIGRADETRETSVPVEEDVSPDEEKATTTEVDLLDELDSLEDEAMDMAESGTDEDCVEDGADDIEDVKENHPDEVREEVNPPKQQDDSQPVEKNENKSPSSQNEDGIKEEQEAQDQGVQGQQAPPEQQQVQEQQQHQQKQLPQQPLQQQEQPLQQQLPQPQQSEERSSPSPEPNNNNNNNSNNNNTQIADGKSMLAEGGQGRDFMEDMVVKTEPEEASDLEPEEMDFDFPRVIFPSFAQAYRPRPGCPATVTSETIGQQTAEDSSENTPPPFPLYSSAIFPARQNDRFARSIDGLAFEEQSSSTAARPPPSAVEAPPLLDAARSTENDTLGSSLKPESRERQSCAMQAGATPSLPQQARSASENGQSVLGDIVIKQEVNSDETSPCTLTRGNFGSARFWPETMSSMHQDGSSPSGGMPGGSLHRQHQGLNSHRQDDGAIPSTSRGTPNRILMQDIYNQLAGSRPLLRGADDDSVPLYSQVLSAPTFSLNDIMSHRPGLLFRPRNLPPDCECGTKFRSIQDFNLHQCRATFDRRYSCPVCYKRWSMLDHLKQHMKIHTGQRPHVCNVCGKAFRQSGHLTRHAVIHSGAKPYRCPICGRGFNVSGNCQRHMRIHTAVSNVRQEYECCVCRQVFPTSTDRWYHMRTHMP